MAEAFYKLGLAYEVREMHAAAVGEYQNSITELKKSADSDVTALVAELETKVDDILKEAERVKAAAAEKEKKEAEDAAALASGSASDAPVNVLVAKKKEEPVKEEEISEETSDEPAAKKRRVADE